MRRNVSGQYVGVQMITAADGTAFTGTVTVYVTGDNGTQGLGSVGSGVCTHEGNGYHSYAPAQAETNYTHVAFTYIGTGAIPATVQIYPVAYDASGQFTVGSHASGAIAAASFASGAVDAAALATDAVTEIADGLLNRDMSTGTDSGSATVRTVRQALRILRNKVTTAGGTLTVTKEDDSTTSWSGTLTTDAGANPVTAVDPADA
jgi:hypothetical protein